jgi:hypothetical protein
MLKKTVAPAHGLPSFVTVAVSVNVCPAVHGGDGEIVRVTLTAETVIELVPSALLYGRLDHLNISVFSYLY